MLGITDLTAYVLGVIAIILLPGPNSIFCLTVAGQYGAKTAYRAIAGIFIGDCILILATVLGAGTVLKNYPAVFWVIKILGGLYLAYIGFNLLKSGIQGWKKPMPISPDIEVTPVVVAAPKVFSRALTLSLLNPKAILFLLSFFVQFVDPKYAHPTVSFLVLGIILQTISMLYLNILVISGTRLVSWFRRSRHIAALGMSSVGALFMGFAVKLWLATVG